MSAKLMGTVWDLDIPHPMAWVLMALADHADHDGGNLYVGQQRLCWKTSYSERQIRRILDQLEDAGIIIPEGGGSGRGLKQSYRISLDNVPRKPKFETGKKRSKCPGSGGNDSDGEDGEKEDKMSALSLVKSGQNDRIIADKMTGFPEDKGGHFDTGKADISDIKADISNIKADISNISHDKERARGLTIREPLREPSVIEPSCEKPIFSSPENSEIPKEKTAKDSTKKKHGKHECKIPNCKCAIIFDYWKERMENPAAVLDANRRGVIVAALENYSPEELRLAIDGCRASDWWMNNGRNGISDILKNSDRINTFIQLARKTPSIIRAQRAQENAGSQSGSNPAGFDLSQWSEAAQQTYLNSLKITGTT